MKLQTYIRKTFVALFLLPLALQAQVSKEFFRAAGTPQNPKVQISFNRYNTSEGLAALGKKIAAAHPNLVRRKSIGKSAQGRDMWMLEITNYKVGNPDRKPGFYVDGNIHSNEIQGSEICLYTAWYLTESFGNNATVTEMLNKRIFYIVPTINPDARDNFMKEPNTPHSPRSGMIPLDDDRDGLVDEDGYDDLNGDGSITQMRRKDPNGDFIIDPQDPRKMIRIGPDDVVTAQRYEYLGNEGIDNDHDGRINEDGSGSYDPNRDWGWKWQPDYIQRGAYKYPFSLPENRSIADFVLSHPNIAGAQSYHNNGGMILRGPGAKEDVATYNRQDVRIYDAIGLKGQKMIPGYRYLTVYKDLYSVFGGELDWFYGSRGVYTFSNELFTDFDYYKTNKRDRNQRYDFDKELLMNDAFTPWKTYMHPRYGEIEIGGFKKNFGRATPGFQLEEQAHRNMAFTFYHASQMPNLSIPKIEEKKIGNGYKEITVSILNDRLMPTHASQDLKYKITRPDFVSISGVKVVAAMQVLNDDFNVTREQKVNPSKFRLANIPGKSIVKVRWIVKGNSKFTITVDSEKGGLVTKKSN